MNWLEMLNDDPLPWLLEPDPANPSVRYLTYVNVLGRTQSDPDVIESKKEMMSSGPIPAILDAQDREGFWVQDGPGYYPKYRGTAWQIIFLAQFGADCSIARVQRGCEYVLDNSRSVHGGFSMNALPSGMIHCLEGNLVAALIDLGLQGDSRLTEAQDWLARSVTGTGIASSDQKKEPIRYLRSGNSGPGFLCSANDHLPCAWGAVKAMLALAKIPPSDRTKEISKAIDAGASFLLSTNPANADYPMGYSEKPNRSWFKFGFPVAYVTDVLQNLEVLTMLGYGSDSRLAPALQLLLEKQDEDGRWTMEYTYNGKTWVDVEEMRKPSKWVTYRAMKVLTQAMA
ncbi:MAG TPA: nitrogen fixation protein NifH [candidate division Zixibacteria bacterium]|nr:nitrogen fixation protein NifH [candidate division Zixibacteria bacterium]